MYHSHYHSHWGLNESPLSGAIDARRFHRTATHEEGLARLHFLVEERRRLGLLLGEAGVGKSLLCEVFRRQLSYSGRQVALVSLIGASPQDVLFCLATQLGLEPAAHATEFHLWRLFADRIAANRCQKIGTVLLLDDADEAPSTTLDLVARMAHLDLTPQARLTLVLTGNCDRLSRLGVRLLEIAELRIDLECWDAAETAAYLTAALTQAGATREIFTATALGLLHQMAGGVPRRVKQLADLALLAGAGRDATVIDADIVDSAYRELGVVVDVPAAGRYGLDYVDLRGA